MLNNFANLVNNYKIKYKLFISFIIKYFKIIIIVSKVIVLILLINIIIFVLLLKKYNRLSKTIENPLIFKKKDKLSKIKTTTNSKKDNNIKILF